MKPLLSVAAVLAIGFLFGALTARGPEAAHAAVTAPPPPVDTTGCHHIEPSVYVGCDNFFAEGSIKAVIVTVTTNSNKKTELRIRTGHPDAIFLTRDAALRFLAPYYCCADKQRAENLDRLRAQVAAATILP
jgi:hypothetical protein